MELNKHCEIMLLLNESDGNALICVPWASASEVNIIGEIV